MRRRSSLSVLAVALSILTAPLAAKNEAPLSTGITGSTPSDPRRNPTEILRSAEVQQLVLAIAERPHTQAEIDAAIADRFFDVDDMVAVGLLREEDGRFWIDFNLLRVEDQMRILEVTESIGRNLAQAFLERRTEFEALANRHDQPHDVNSELLYVVLGCFSLDWDGLSLTEERGWREGPLRTIDDRSFTPWAKEKGADVSLKGLYWGSHNHPTGLFKATTFGDHDALPRFGFPDLLWGAGRAFRDFEDADARRAAGRAVTTYALDMLPDIVEVMILLRHENLSSETLAERTGIPDGKLDRVLKLLQAAEYVELNDGAYEASVVVLLPEDSSTVDAIVAIGREVMIRWHEANYTRVREQLSDLTPGRNGVPFERVYTEIWHFAFGIANRTLVEEGLFADPYDESRRHRGFIPAIWASELTE